MLVTMPSVLAQRVFLVDLLGFIAIIRHSTRMRGYPEYSFLTREDKHRLFNLNTEARLDFN